MTLPTPPPIWFDGLGSEVDNAQAAAYRGDSDGFLLCRQDLSRLGFGILDTCPAGWWPMDTADVLARISATMRARGYWPETKVAGDVAP